MAAGAGGNGGAAACACGSMLGGSGLDLSSGVRRVSLGSATSIDEARSKMQYPRDSNISADSGYSDEEDDDDGEYGTTSPGRAVCTETT